MNNDHFYCPEVEPVPRDVKRPVWSVMIPTYNCASYLREALSSVLAQDPGPEVMQIEVVDNCSTLDDPESVVAELGQGRVSFFRQSENVGRQKNFETCLQRSRGHLVHLLHGDDCVLNGFYDRLGAAFEKHPEIGAAFSRCQFVSEQGKWIANAPKHRAESGILEKWLKRIALEQLIQPPAIVVRRDVYEKLGGFDNRLACADDWEMWVRIAANYPVWYEVEALALSRDTGSSQTKTHLSTGEYIRDAFRAIEVIQYHLPESVRKEIANRAKEYAVYSGLISASKLMLQGNVEVAKLQIQETLKYNPSPKTLLSASPFILKFGKQKLQERLQHLGTRLTNVG